VRGRKVEDKRESGPSESFRSNLKLPFRPPRGEIVRESGNLIFISTPRATATIPSAQSRETATRQSVDTEAPFEKRCGKGEKRNYD